MRKGNKDGVLVDLCANCGGLWLDAGELEALERKQAKDRGELVKQARKELAAEAQQVLTVVGMCPKCQAARLRQIVRRGVELDYCPHCEGLFFDDRELERVMKAAKDEAPAGFLESVLAFFRKPGG
jgi:Zn-finger nucleic acid-binding protein